VAPSRRRSALQPLGLWPGARSCSRIRPSHERIASAWSQRDLTRYALVLCHVTVGRGSGTRGRLQTRRGRAARTAGRQGIAPVGLPLSTRYAARPLGGERLTAGFGFHATAAGGDGTDRGVTPPRNCRVPAESTNEALVIATAPYAVTNNPTSPNGVRMAQAIRSVAENGAPPLSSLQHAGVCSGGRRSIVFFVSAPFLNDVKRGLAFLSLNWDP